MADFVLLPNILVLSVFAVLYNSPFFPFISLLLLEPFFVPNCLVTVFTSIAFTSIFELSCGFCPSPCGFCPSPCGFCPSPCGFCPSPDVGLDLGLGLTLGALLPPSNKCKESLYLLLILLLYTLSKKTMLSSNCGSSIDFIFY